MRILLCDRRRAVRDGLRVALEKEGLTIVGEATSGIELLAACRKLRPDVVVTDVCMPDLNGIDATRQLLADMPQLRVVGLSIAPDPCHVAAMFAAGAVAYVPQTADCEELVRTLRRLARGPGPAEAAAGRTRSDPAGAALAGGAPHPVKPLSARERDVLKLIALGKSSKEIATILDIGVTTVETHRRQITDKLGLRTIAELTKYAVRIGLASLD
jgi:DNA-binding NarL/FixJ family response regulator